MRPYVDLLLRPDNGKVSWVGISKPYSATSAAIERKKL